MEEKHVMPGERAEAYLREAMERGWRFSNVDGSGTDLVFTYKTDDDRPDIRYGFSVNENAHWIEYSDAERGWIRVRSTWEEDIREG